MKIKKTIRPLTCLRWILLAGVLISGLATIIGTGGGGGGGGIDSFTLENDIAGADLNGDGRLDLALAATYIADEPPHPGYVYIYHQDPQKAGIFFPASRYGVGNDPWGTAIADINGDGSHDVVTANTRSDSISILFQDPLSPGTFIPAVSLSCGQSPYGVAAGLLNGDDRPDIVTANNDRRASVSILLQNPVPDPVGGFLPARYYSTGEAAESVAIGDLNGDGLMDIAVDGAATVFVMFQNRLSPGEFLPPVSLAAGERPCWVTICDLDGDGFNDLSVANAGSSESGANASVSVLIQDRDDPGAFVLESNYETPDGARKLVAEDLNSDGRPDLAVAAVSYQSDSPGSVSALFQDADSPGRFMPAENNYAGFTPNFITIGDFNQDGEADIATNEGPSILFQDPNNAGVFLPVAIIGDFFDD